MSAKLTKPTRAEIEREFKADLARIRAMTDAEVMAAARSDPDALPMTKAELARAERVSDIAAEVRRVRASTGLSQPQFAKRFGFHVAALRDWEQGRRWPDRAARVLLRVIEREPKAVARALAD